MIHSLPLAVLAIVFAATVVRSAAGFGEALVAVPLLAFFLPLPVAAPLAVLVSITIAAVVVAQDWRDVHFASAGWLVGSSLCGIPLGLLLLTSSHQGGVLAGLGGVLIAFAASSLWGGALPRLRHESRRWLLLCGFAAGVLGGAYGMNGPPLVVYGTLRRWPPPQFRATLQAYFLPASLAGMAGFTLAGLWTPVVTRDYLLSLPLLLPAIGLGRVLNRRIPAPVFQKLLHAALLAIGLLLLLR